MKKTRLLMMLLTHCMWTAAGCTSQSDRWIEKRPRVYPASGEVIYAGKPLTDANILFYSPTQNLSAYARTDSQGKFRLSTFGSEDGVVDGDNVVTITKVESVPLHPSKIIPGEEPASDEVRSVIPGRYGIRDKSGLKANVAKSSNNYFRFELTK